MTEEMELADFLSRPHAPDMPLHTAVRLAIEDAIDAQALKPGDPLPSERNISRITGVSRLTVRKALDDLAVSGRVRTVPAIGTFVAGNRLELHDVLSFSERTAQEGRRPSARVLEARLVQADPAIVARLRLPVGQELVFLRRVRLVDGAPVMVETSHLDARRFAWVLDDVGAGSLYRALRDREGIEIASIAETIGAGLAGAEAAPLDCSPADPVLTRDLVAYDTRGRPIEHSTAVARADRCTYAFVVTRRAGAHVTVSVHGEVGQADPELIGDPEVRAR